MLTVEINKQLKTALLTPDGTLSRVDFESAARIIDPFIAEHGNLNGIVIYSELFPGWDSFAGMIAHFKFVKNHHKYLRRVALVTDSKLGDFAEKIAVHFVEAEIRHFEYDDLHEAENWIQSN